MGTIFSSSSCFKKKIIDLLFTSEKFCKENKKWHSKGERKIVSSYSLVIKQNNFELFWMFNWGFSFLCDIFWGLITVHYIIPTYFVALYLTPKPDLNSIVDSISLLIPKPYTILLLVLGVTLPKIKDLISVFLHLFISFT